MQVSRQGGFFLEKKNGKGSKLSQLLYFASDCKIKGLP
jgi:hypothetical protein